MNKESFEKLLSDQPPEIRAKGVLLFNGAAQSSLAYKELPTAANLRDYEAAQAALDRFVAQLMAGAEAEKPFPTIAEVLDCLKSDGWKVTKTSLYRHAKEGKLLPRPDGAYAPKDVERYARTFLKQQSTGKKVNEKLDTLQRERLEKELRSLDLDIKRKERQEEKESGNLVPREQLDIELATRAGILDAGLRHWIQSHAAEWIRLVGGDTKKVGDLINLMGRDLDEYINAYASTKEYQVMIDAAREEDLETIDGEEEAGEDTPK